MTDRDLIEKLLAHIETCVHEVRTLAHPERIADDVRERRFVEHTLQLAIQGALDVASHIVSDERMGEPTTHRDLFALLAGRGWLDRELASVLERMAGFHNVLVHGYTKVDPEVVRRAATEHLDDLLAFVRAVRSRLV